MTELVDFYRQQLSRFDDDMSWLNQLRHKSFDLFADIGFPTRKNEDWRYTDVQSISASRFLSTQVETTKASSNANDIIVKLTDNEIVDLDKEKALLPDAVIVMSLIEAIKQHPDIVKPYLNELSSSQKCAFTAINTALMEQGVFVYVPKNCVVEKPITIHSQKTKDESMHHIRNLIICEQNSSVDLIELYDGGDNTYYNNVITEVFVGSNARVNHIKLQNEGANAYHIGTLFAKLEKDSTINSYSYSTGGAVTRSDTLVNFTQAGGHCSLQGLYVVNDAQHVDHHTTVNHRVAHCTSDEFYKGILNDKSSAVFNGKVVVANNAQKTSANQQNKNLLLSKQAEVNTKPQLEIYADDVKCAHGATVGQLDSQVIFYLRSRGLSEAKAREFLIEAFANDVLQPCPDDGIKRAVTGILKEKLGMRQS